MHRDADFEVVLRTPWAGPWRRFRRPTRMILAHDSADVERALGEVDDAVRGGSYAAGFVTFEASAAFGLPVGSGADGLPLVCFGVFDPRDVDSISQIGRAHV